VHSIVLMLEELKPAICSKCKGMLTNEVVLCRDNAQPHVATVTLK
jgi:hypothetical protein